MTSTHIVRRTHPLTATADHPIATHVTNHHLSAWIRVWVWCLANHNQHGHAPAYLGQLRRELDLPADEVSRAIRLARQHRVIDPCSTAACLVLPGHAIAPCDSTHREGQ